MADEDNHPADILHFFETISTAGEVATRAMIGVHDLTKLPQWRKQHKLLIETLDALTAPGYQQSEVHEWAVALTTQVLAITEALIEIGRIVDRNRERINSQLLPLLNDLEARRKATEDGV